MRSSPWERSALAVWVVGTRGGIPGALRCLAYRRASPGAIITAAMFSLTGFDVVRSTSVLNHRRRPLLLYDHVTRGCSPCVTSERYVHKPALLVAGRLDNRTLGPLTAYQSALTYMAITDGYSEGHMLGSFVWWAVRSLVLLELCSHEDKLSCSEPGSPSSLGPRNSLRCLAWVRGGAQP